MGRAIGRGAPGQAGPTDAPFITLAPSTARVAAGNGDVFDLLDMSGRGWDGLPPMLLVQSDVTAVSGTASPTLTVFVEDSVDGGVTWNNVGAFAAQTTANRLVIAIGIRGDAYPANFRWPFNARRVRARWTITGTNPSFTFSVKCVLA